jgi:hypothetical protein
MAEIVLVHGEELPMRQKRWESAGPTHITKYAHSVRGEVIAGEAGLIQRHSSKLAGRATHIAFIESGRRKPPFKLKEDAFADSLVSTEMSSTHQKEKTFRGGKPSRH